LCAVAAFKHLPPIVAAEWAENALETEFGSIEIERMLEEEATLATRHHRGCADAWRTALDEFRRDHPMH
jgi:hypothetical protein